MAGAEDDDGGNIQAQIAFDRSSLAYACLKGCVYMVNKSNKYYTSILMRTLREDYNIQVTYKAFANSGESGSDDSNGRLSKELDKQLRLSEAERGASLMQREECTRLISNERGEVLQQRKSRTEELTDIEEQQLWVYHMVVERYKMVVSAGSIVELDLLKKYVGPFFPKESKNAMLSQYYALKRLDRLYESSVSEEHCKYQTDLRTIGELHNSAMEVHETKLHNFYKPITEVGKLLEALQPKWRDLLSHTNAEGGIDAEGAVVFPVSNKTLITKLIAWLSQMDNERYNDLMDTLDISMKRSDTAKHTRPSLIAALGGSSNDAVGGESADGTPDGSAKRPGRSATDVLEKLLFKAFGMSLAPPKQSKKGFRDVDMSLYAELRRRRVRFDECLFD